MKRPFEELKLKAPCYTIASTLNKCVMLQNCQNTVTTIPQMGMLAASMYFILATSAVFTVPFIPRSEQLKPDMVRGR